MDADAIETTRQQIAALRKKAHKEIDESGDMFMNACYNVGPLLEQADALEESIKDE